MSVWGFLIEIYVKSIMGLICQNLLVPLQFECEEGKKKEHFPACYSYNWATSLVLLRTCVRHTAAGRTIKSNVAEEIREQIRQMSWRVVVSNQNVNMPLSFSTTTKTLIRCENINGQTTIYIYLYLYISISVYIQIHTDVPVY